MLKELRSKMQKKESKMAKTTMQTTIISSPSNQESYGLAPCPISPISLPIEVDEDTISWDLGVRKSNGDCIYWDRYGVTKKCIDGTTITWIKKPTLSDAIYYSSSSTSSYYRFHCDGSVEAKYNQESFYWSSEIEGTYEEGEIIYDKEDAFEEEDTPIPCIVCGSDCRGWDYEKWGICSRDCLSENYRY